MMVAYFGLILIAAVIGCSDAWSISWGGGGLGSGGFGSGGLRSGGFGLGSFGSGGFGSGGFGSGEFGSGGIGSGRFGSGGFGSRGLESSWGRSGSTWSRPSPRFDFAANRDSMSFGDAFADAHRSLGAGDTFSWRGNSYSTNRADRRNLGPTRASSSSWSLPSSSFSSPPASPTKYAHDIKDGSALRNLFNEEVEHVQRVKRPLGSKGGKLSASLGFPHKGVKITTKSGKVYLHHKGPDYGDKSDAVLVDAKHMSNAWENDGDAIKVNGRKTVGQLHAAGVETGQYEALDFDKNCFGDAEAVLNEARSP